MYILTIQLLKQNSFPMYDILHKYCHIYELEAAIQKFMLLFKERKTRSFIILNHLQMVLTDRSFILTRHFEIK